MSERVAAEFVKAEESVAWAHEAIDEFDAAAHVFFEGDVAKIFAEFDADTGENLHKVRIVQPLPDILRRKATEALNNTRHAFDQATYAARKLTGSTSGDHPIFPWAENPTDLERLLKNRGIDKRLWQTFSFYEPYPRSDLYPRGDDLCRALAKLANQKHTIGLTVGGDIHSIGHPDVKGGAIIQSLKMLTPKWDPVKNEAELMRWRGDIEITKGYDFRFKIMLREAVLPEPVDAGFALRMFAAKANAVIHSLKGRCGEIC